MIKLFYSILGYFLWFLDMAVPRFLTEKLALIYNEDDDDYDVYQQLWLCDENDEFDAICTCRCFNLFGFALFPVFYDIEDL